MFWLALIFIVLGALVVCGNLYLLWRSGFRLWRDEGAPRLPSRVPMVGSILAVLGVLLSGNQSLALVALAVVVLDPDGPLWMPVWLAWRHFKQKGQSEKHVV